MKPAPFTYHAPRSLAEAVAALEDLAPADGRVLAGGQSLVPAMALRLATPAHVIDINGVPGLDRLAVEGGVLSVGACVRHAAFHRPVAPGPLGALLAAVAPSIAHLPIRTRGTFCGSIANADPASEWCLVAVTFGATMRALSTRGERRLAADAFFEGTMSTALAPDELLQAVDLPLLRDGTRCGFDEFAPRAGDFAIAMALVTFRVEAGRIVAPRIGVGAAEDRPRRIAAAESMLEGRPPDAIAFATAAQAAAAAIAPLADPQLTAAHRRSAVRACVRRALERAVAGLPGGAAP
jgi:carbon-monoxide dehydrogenase medium subunit